MCSISLDSSVARLAAPRTSARRAMLSRLLVLSHAGSVRPALPASHSGVRIETPRGPEAALNAISTMGQRVRNTRIIR